jgi:hypothetical protein
VAAITAGAATMGHHAAEATMGTVAIMDTEGMCGAAVDTHSSSVSLLTQVHTAAVTVVVIT